MRCLLYALEVELDQAYVTMRKKNSPSVVLDPCRQACYMRAGAARGLYPHPQIKTEELL